MKLLSKSEIQQAKSKEERQAVEEGLKLAKRVDSLRELSAAEEASLAKFRSETIASIYEEISKETSKLDSLKREVADLEDRKKKALEPLLEEEEQIQKGLRELESTGEELASREALIRNKENEVEIALKKAVVLRTQAENAILDAKSRLSDAAIKQEAAMKEKENIDRIRRDLDKKVSETNRTLLHRDQLATSRERSVTIREQNISQREKELYEGWRLLNDRIATFERTIKRNK